jgi:hypothetical protein
MVLQSVHMDYCEAQQLFSATAKLAHEGQLAAILYHILLAATIST